MHLRFLLSLLSFLFLQENPPADDPPVNDPPKPGDDPKPPKIEWTKEQQDEINRIAAKERREGAKRAREDRDAEIEEQRKKDAVAAQRTKDQEAGEFEKVKESLQNDAKTASDERDTLKDQRDTLLGLLKADVDATWNDLPEEVKDAYDGEDDDVLAKKQHMTRMAKVTERLTAASSGPGNGPNPPAGEHKIDINKEIARKAQAYRI